MGTSNPFMKFMYGSKITEVHRLAAKVLIMQTRKIVICVLECKIPCVVYMLPTESQTKNGQL